MRVTAIRTRLFEEGGDLPGFVRDHLPRLRDGSVVVVTSKIVALSEGRTARFAGPKERERAILAESDRAVPTEHVWLTVADGQVMMSAGIDDSNVDGAAVLRPRDSFRTAARLRTILRRTYGVRRLGVIVSDSRTLPLRAGVTGVALGYAGFRGLRDYRGTPDLHGRPFRFASTDVADSLAAAATLLMGEGRERRPLAVVEDGPVEFRERTDRAELRIAPRDDVYRPLFENVRWVRGRRRN